MGERKKENERNGRKFCVSHIKNLTEVDGEISKTLNKSQKFLLLLLLLLLLGQFFNFHLSLLLFITTLLVKYTLTVKIYSISIFIIKLRQVFSSSNGDFLSQFLLFSTL